MTQRAAGPFLAVLRRSLRWRTRGAMALRPAERLRGAAARLCAATARGRGAAASAAPAFGLGL